MSITKHGPACHCSECHRFNTMHGESFKLSRQLLEAQKAGRLEEVEKLTTELEQLHSRITALGDKLGRQLICK